jgi:flagellar hook-length control protein FliK
VGGLAASTGPSRGADRVPGGGGAPAAGPAATVVPALPGLEAQLAVKARELLVRGKTEIRIRLDPPSLGRLKIRLEIEDGRAVARIAASSPEAASLLARDREELVRAFQNQGFERVEVHIETDQESTARDRSDREGTKSGTEPLRDEKSPEAEVARDPRRTHSKTGTSAGRGVDLFV